MADKIYYGPGDPMFDRFTAIDHAREEVRTPGGLERLLDRLYPPLEHGTLSSDPPSQAAHPPEDVRQEGHEVDKK
jgi:hypothetical protein